MAPPYWWLRGCRTTHTWRCNALEDRPGDTGHLVVHQRGGPAWLKEHVTALRSWASTIAGAEISAARPPGDQPRRHQGAEHGPTDPQPPRPGGTPPTSTRGGSAPPDTTGSRRPGDTPPLTHPGADPANTPPASLSPPTSPARGRWPSRARCLTERGWPPPSPYITVHTDHGSTRWTPRSSSTSYGTQIASEPRGSPRAQRRWSTRCP